MRNDVGMFHLYNLYYVIKRKLYHQEQELIRF